MLNGPLLFQMAWNLVVAIGIAAVLNGEPHNWLDWIGVAFFWLNAAAAGAIALTVVR